MWFFIFFPSSPSSPLNPTVFPQGNCACFIPLFLLVNRSRTASKRLFPAGAQILRRQLTPQWLENITTVGDVITKKERNWQLKHGWNFWRIFQNRARGQPTCLSLIKMGATVTGFQNFSIIPDWFWLTRCFIFITSNISTLLKTFLILTGALIRRHTRLELLKIFQIRQRWSHTAIPLERNHSRRF